MGCLSGHKVQGERKLADLKKLCFTMAMFYLHS